ncbi:glutathione S-transferase N-terminal domain-containing protein [Candidatus Pacearchaeota archaeon]|nr:glutathione S-transferase N-terminal domain-containing protein [Candidatus Pacearchaeota archaeon]
MSVIVYTTPECPYCRQAKVFFEKNDVPFEVLDVSVDCEIFDEMQRKSNNMSVPVIDIDGEIFIGFDEEELNEALGMSSSVARDSFDF